MKNPKTVIVHLASAIITGFIALALVNYGPGFAKWFEGKFGTPSEGVVFLGLFISVFALYFAVQLIHDILNYLWFRVFMDEPRACGLYVEAYFDESHLPKLSLLTVYFDLRSEELKISGYAYCQDEKNKSELAPFASWHSRALHHTASTNHFEIFYIHEGDVETDDRMVRGTTICNLPTSAVLSRHGHFCDLKNMNVTDIKPQYFDIIRARDIHKREFFNRVKGPITRFKYFLKLGAPGEDVFQDFAFSQKYALLEQYEKAHRTKAMMDVYELLRNPTP